MNESWDGSIPFHEWKKQRYANRQGIGQKNVRPATQPKKKLSSQSEWRKQIIQRDGKRCKLCGSTYWLEAHHIIYKSQGGERTNPLNGIMLCKVCHLDVHAGKIKFSQKDLHYKQIQYFEEIGAVVWGSNGEIVKGRHHKSFR